jgi:hypothetical protein
MNNLENIEDRKVEMTALEVLAKVYLEENHEKAEALKNRAIKAGMDFSKIDVLTAKYPDLDVVGLLKKAKIKPEETFDISSLN